nr:non-ribosomal peptide synthetase [Paenibacillus phyllosphaerae]
MFDTQEQWYPLSPSQKRIWYLESKHGCAVNNNNLLLYLQGEVQAKALEEAVIETIRRHASLRLQFMESQGNIMQRVSPKLPERIPVHDFRDGPTERFERWRSQLVRTQVHIGQEQLCLFEIAIASEQTTALFMKLHHAIIDGWSVQALISTIAAAYAEITGVQRIDKYLQSDYSHRDVVIEEYDYVQSAAYGRDKSYWTQTLSELPDSFQMVESEDTTANTIRLQVPPELVERVQQFCRSHHVKPSLFYPYLMYLYLHLTTSHNDLLLGMPFINRIGAEAKKHLVGMFNNYVPMRLYVSDEVKVSEALRQAGQALFMAYKHQRFPLEDMVRDIPGLREHSALFQMTVNYYNQDLDMSAMGNPFYLDELHSGHQSYALQFKVKEWERFGNPELVFELDYRTAYYSESIIQAIGRSLMQLAERIVECPDIRIGQLTLLSEQEHRAAVYDWNNTEMAYAKNETLTRLIRSQAARTPDRIALVFEDRTLTFGQMEAQGCRLAHSLRSRGIGHGQTIGLLTYHSFESIIGMLAIMKTGAAYLPLDPQYPAERISYILEDAGASLVLTNGSLHRQLPDRMSYLDLDQAQHDCAGPLSEWEDLSEPTALAYMIYTSGSTGKPKGVAITHRSAVNYCWWAKQAYVKAESDAFAIYSSLSFDLTVTSLFVPLLAGIKAIIYRQSEPMEFVLSRVIRERAANIIKLTPAHLEIAVKEGYERPAVSRFIVGGERFGCLLAERASSVFAGAEIYNEYGPTEATVGCMIYRYAGGGELSGSVPIGRPIGNMRIYVLDERLCPVPVEHEGEIYIAGDGLAAGYLNRPALNEERFVPDPFVAGQLMYKSGDRARVDVNGDVIYIGRIDEQLNFRGYRIEQGEIEAIIANWPGINQTCVTVKQNATGHPVLCCYYTGGEDVDIGGVKRQLADQLPAYMIPGSFIRLDSMPLTANGKKNVNALPAPARSVADSDYAGPETANEKRLWMAWSSILGTDRFGIDDSFWEIGGDSFHASMLVAELYASCGAALTIRQLYEHSTIRELAKRTSGMDAVSDRLSDEAFEEREHYPLTAIQQMMFAAVQLDGGLHAYLVPGTVPFAGRIDELRMEAAWQALLQRHEAFRTGFEWMNGSVVQRIHPVSGTSPPLPVLIEHDQASLEAFIAQPFELDKPPLIRGCIVRGEKQDVFCYLAHHLVFDKYSERVVKRELRALYEGEALPPGKHRYADYLNDQLLFAGGEELERMERFWQEQYSDAPPQLELPVDMLAATKPVYKGGWLRHEMDARIAQDLSGFAAKHGTTPFMVSLAVFQIMLSKYSGQSDIVVATPSSGRYRPELNEIVGGLITMLPIRCRIEQEAEFASFLSDVVQICLTCMENERYPFDRLVERIVQTREIGVNPLYRAAFVMEQEMESETDATLLAAMARIGYSAKLDVTFRIIHDAKRRKPLTIACEYNAELFHEDTIVRMMKDYEHLLRQLLTQPEQPLAKLALASGEEARQLAERFHETADVPRMPWHLLFEQQASMTPDRIAVVDEQRKLTYEALNQAANRLAGLLRASGARRNKPVALLIERSAAWVVSTLAVLKAGAAFLPIDPSLPDERIRYLLEDSSASLLIAGHEKLHTTLPELGLSTIVFDWEALQTGDGANLPNMNEAEDLAYLIYTSGTTGQPKGTMVPHLGIGNVHRFLMQRAGIGPDDRFLQFASLSFDASVLELAVSLLSGAALHIVSDACAKDLSAFERFVERHQITAAILPPPYVNVLEPKRLPSLAKIIMGGSSPSIEMVRRWAGVKLFNCYGPTEATVMVTMWEVEPNALTGRSHVPIGRPLPNFRLSIIGPDDRPQPIGIPGELCISGIGLARGYVNKPEVTAKKFVRNPESPGEIMYRTGDLAKWLPDGNLVFLGRIDDQVKVRGYRVELGEIEHQLLKLDAIKEAVVLVRQTQGGEKELCAFAVAQLRIDRNTIRRDLAKQLPSWMIPARIVLLPAIPLSMNGKPDRNQLIRHLMQEETKAAAPLHNETERKLVHIWSELLHLQAERIGADTSFFELGGSSLTLLQLQKRLKDDFHKDVAVTELFANPTVALMASCVEERLSPEAFEPLKLAIPPEQAALAGRSIGGISLLKGRLKEALPAAVYEDEALAQALAAVYAYCLLEWSGGQTFELVYRNSAGGGVLSVNREHAGDLKGLLHQIQGQWMSGSSSDMELKLAGLKPSRADQLLPIIYDRVAAGESAALRDLALGVEVMAGVMELTLYYNRSKLRGDSMKAMLGRIGSILQHVLHDAFSITK